MSTPTEQQLRDLLAADAAAAPPAVGLAAGALRRVRRRRRALATCVSGALAVAAVTTAVLITDGPGRTEDSVVAATVDSTSETPPPSDAPAAAPMAGAAADCVQEYSPTAVAGRAFAFDGTVTGIGPGQTNRPGGELDLAAVTFRVHTWFRGGPGDSVTVDMDAPGPAGSAEPAIPPYEIGTRLLVSGESRWGGAPTDDPIAWSCGFTRPYDAGTAARWAAATD